MYIHLGNEVTLSSREMIGIFDMENTTVSKDTQAFLKRSEDDDRVTNVSADLPKSFILCRIDGTPQVFISAISPSTLKKRAKSPLYNSSAL